MVALLWVAAVVGAADPPVRFPESVGEAPTPAPVAVLGADRLYVIDSDLDGFLLVRPAGLVVVSQDPGPLRVRGKFADGPDKSETRTYKGKTVYVLEAAGTGTVYLDFVPAGAKGPAGVISRVLRVEAGQGPKPPPDPDPQPKPDPLVDVQLLKDVQAAYDADPAADKRASLAALAKAMDQARAACGDPTLGDAGALSQRVSADTVAAVGRGKLPGVGAAIGSHLSARLPQQPTAPLTPEVRARAAGAYQTVAATLRAVK